MSYPDRQPVNRQQSEVNGHQTEVNHMQEGVNGHQADVNLSQAEVDRQQSRVNRGGNLSTYSLGMKQAAKRAQAIAHGPKLDGFAN